MRMQDYLGHILGFPNFNSNDEGQMTILPNQAFANILLESSGVGGKPENHTINWILTYQYEFCYSS